MLYEHMALAMYAETRKIIEEWANKQGHDRCHYYPELFERLAALYGIPVPQALKDLPPQAEFESECNKFRQQLYNKASGA